MIPLNLTEYHAKLRLSSSDGARYVFDPVRKKKYILTPEELVRQSWISYLIAGDFFSSSRMSVEKTLKINEANRRYDLVIYNKAIPEILFEFKSFNHKLTEENCLQIAQYNLVLKVPFLVLSNGMEHYAFKADFQLKKINRLADFPWCS